MIPIVHGSPGKRFSVTTKINDCNVSAKNKLQPCVLMISVRRADFVRKIIVRYIGQYLSENMYGKIRIIIFHISKCQSEIHSTDSMIAD